MATLPGSGAHLRPEGRDRPVENGTGALLAKRVDRAQHEGPRARCHHSSRLPASATAGSTVSGTAGADLMRPAARGRIGQRAQGHDCVTGTDARQVLPGPRPAASSPPRPRGLHSAPGRIRPARRQGLARPVPQFRSLGPPCSGTSEIHVETYLRKAVSVPIEACYPDPNNPRLALPDAPGYTDAAALFDETLRKAILEEIGNEAYGIGDLDEAIAGQGWMPIDNMLGWQHPDDTDRWVIVEGNRRLVTLHELRTTYLPKARKKLARMEAKAPSYPKSKIEEYRAQVQRLEQVIADTQTLSIVPLDAPTHQELERKLPRVLAVRHITGAKEWGNYAEDLWLLSRYEHLFADTHGEDADLFWDPATLKRVAHEASLGETTTKRQLRAAKWFSHFRAEWEDELPEGESFGKSDYYLFENISKKPWVRQKLGISEDDMAIPERGETALFTWVFKEPRTKRAETNPNVFYRHENILVWDQMNRYDEAQGTSFANRFDVENPGEAPTMHEVEAEYLMHKATKKPHAVLDDLLRRLQEFSATQLTSEGQFLRAQLEQVRDMSGKFIKMIDASVA